MARQLKDEYDDLRYKMAMKYCEGFDSHDMENEKTVSTEQHLEPSNSSVLGAPVVI
jgi:hypothetical protein